MNEVYIKSAVDNEIENSNHSVCIYNSEKVKLYFIKDLNDLIDEVNKLHHYNKTVEENTQLYYRGHSNANYLLDASIERNKEYIRHENHMVEDILTKNADEFSAGYQTHFDKLKQMQHYFLPTRLLDITESPLAGLYFAREIDEIDKAKDTYVMDAELNVFNIPRENIKYTRSDNVGILSALPFLTTERKKEVSAEVNRYFDENKLERELDTKHDKKQLKKFNKKEPIEKLLHEVAIYKPNFKPRIEPNTLRKNYVVQPYRDNKRVFLQMGSFIIKPILLNDREEESQYQGILKI